MIGMSTPAERKGVRHFMKGKLKTGGIIALCAVAVFALLAFNSFYRVGQGEEALVRALAAAGDDEGAQGALARKDVGELQQAARAAEDGGRAPRQEPRAEGEAALEGAAGESLERHGPTSLS